MQYEDPWSGRRSFAGACVAVAIAWATPAAAEGSNPPERLYWCRHDGGNQYAQAEPCAPGTEIRSAATIPGTNGLTEGVAPEGARQDPAAAAAGSAAPAGTVAGPQVASADAQSGGTSSTPAGPDTLRQGQLAWLRYLAYGVVFGGVAKLFKRSFWGWFAIGFVVRIVLVSLDWVKF